MNMRKKPNRLLLLLLIAIFSACNKTKNKHQHSGGQERYNAAVYTCPMHPEVVSNQPGQCPKCNMNLELKMSDAKLQIVSPNKQVLSRQATVKLEQDSGGATIKAQGYIDIDRTRNQTVSARFGGRIEKLYVKFNLQSVKQGDKIMELYSPELQTIQEEHLFLIKSSAETSLVEKSRERLRLLGVTDDQIKQLEKVESVAATISVFSPSDGFVFFDTQTTGNGELSQSASTMNNMGMTQELKTEKTFNASTAQIREGMYVNAGQILFSVNDLKQVWALLSVPSEDIVQIRQNQSVEIVSESNPNKKITGKVALTEKIFEERNQRFARVRIILPNPDKSLKINSLVTADIAIANSINFLVPASAVYRTGLNSYVWVKTDTTESGTGVFKLKKVSAGANNNGLIAITDGLLPSEEIAREAGFMTDSETFLNTN